MPTNKQGGCLTKENSMPCCYCFGRILYNKKPSFGYRLSLGFSSAVVRQLRFSLDFL